MTRLVACMMTTNHEAWIRFSLGSVLPFVDRVIIIDGGSTDKTLDIIDSFHDPKIEVYYHKWVDNNGGQRNRYLEKLEGEEDSWVLVLDSDEVVSDDFYKVRDALRNAKHNAFDVHMEHFVWNLGLADATQERHYVLRRLFKFQSKLVYPEVEHPVLQNVIGEVGKMDEFTIFHYSYVNGIQDVMKKFLNNVKRSNIHSREFLTNWKNMHVLGRYPVRPFDLSKHPRLIKEFFGL